MLHAAGNLWPHAAARKNNFLFPQQKEKEKKAADK
jgi:hypothetical protein